MECGEGTRGITGNKQRRLPANYSTGAPSLTNIAVPYVVFFPPFSPSYVISGIKSASADTEKKQKCVYNPDKTWNTVSSHKKHVDSEFSHHT